MRLRGGTDFEQAAKDQETSALDLTFDSETTSPNEEVIAAADKLDARTGDRRDRDRFRILCGKGDFHI